MVWLGYKNNFLLNDFRGQYNVTYMVWHHVILSSKFISKILLKCLHLDTNLLFRRFLPWCVTFPTFPTISYFLLPVIFYNWRIVFYKCFHNYLCNNHCTKIVQMQSFLWSVSSCIQTENSAEKTPYLGTFHKMNCCHN